MLVKAPNGGLQSEWIMSRRRGKRVRGRGKEGRGGVVKKGERKRKKKETQIPLAMKEKEKGKRGSSKERGEEEKEKRDPDSLSHGNREFLNARSFIFEGLSPSTRRDLGVRIELRLI